MVAFRRTVYLSALALWSGSVMLSGYHGAVAAEPLSAEAIRDLIPGNSITFFNHQLGSEVTLYFEAGGQVVGRNAANPNQVIRQQWSISGNGALCRVVPNQQRQMCQRIQADGHKLRFIKPDGSVAFEAVLTTGNRMARAIDGRAGGKGGSPAGAGGGPTLRPGPAQIIAAMDRDGDGTISSREWRGPKGAFKRLDKDEDGIVTSVELAKIEAQTQSKPLLAEAMKIYQVPAAALERREGRGDCVFDPKEHRFRHFVITGYSPNCAFGGTVLFADVTDGDAPMIYEIAMTGRLVWKYDIVGGVGTILDAKERRLHKPMDVARLDNGNTLFGLKEYGIFEVDRAGNTVWKHLDDGVSHDVDRLPDGNTLFVRGWRAHGEDQFREVDRDGRIVWSWTGVEQYAEPVFRPQAEAESATQGDETDPGAVAPGYEGWIHPNAVTRLTDGTTMLSLRNFHRIVFVDRGGAVLRTVPVPFVHDPEIQDNGNILALAPTWGVIEYAQGRPIWRMTAQDWLDRYGVENVWNVRDANRLPNGNIFITSGSRLLEIDPSGRPVWQLVNTKVEAKASSQAQAFFKAQRIGPDGRAYGG